MSVRYFLSQITPSGASISESLIRAYVQASDPRRDEWTPCFSAAFGQVRCPSPEMGAAESDTISNRRIRLLTTGAVLELGSSCQKNTAPATVFATSENAQSVAVGR